MNAFLLTLLQVANASKVVWSCPNGRGIDDNILLDFHHVQDLTGSFKSKASAVKNELADVIKELSDKFADATFTIHGGVDKGKYECHHRFGSFHSSDIGDEPVSKQEALQPLANTELYYHNEARPDLFDAVIDICDDWARQGPAYFESENGPRRRLRIVSVVADQCPRVKNHNEGLESDTIAIITSPDKKVTYPLNGDAIPTCQDREFPSVDEVANELDDKEAHIVFSITPERDSADVIRTCQGSEQHKNDDASQLKVDEWWNTHAKGIFGVKANINTNVDSSLSTLARNIYQAIEDVICNETSTSSTTTTTTTTTTTMPQPADEPCDCDCGCDECGCCEKAVVMIEDVVDKLAGIINGPSNPNNLRAH